jgi:hypothetical protein
MVREAFGRDDIYGEMKKGSTHVLFSLFIRCVRDQITSLYCIITHI